MYLFDWLYNDFYLSIRELGVLITSALVYICSFLIFEENICSNDSKYWRKIVILFNTSFRFYGTVDSLTFYHWKTNNFQYAFQNRKALLELIQLVSLPGNCFLSMKFISKMVIIINGYQWKKCCNYLLLKLKAY